MTAIEQSPPPADQAERQAFFKNWAQLEDSIFKLEQQVKAFNDLAGGMTDQFDPPAWLWLVTEHAEAIRDRFMAIGEIVKTPAETPWR